MNPEEAAKRVLESLRIGKPAPPVSVGRKDKIEFSLNGMCLDDVLDDVAFAFDFNGDPEWHRKKMELVLDITWARREVYLNPKRRDTIHDLCRRGSTVEFCIKRHDGSLYGSARVASIASTVIEYRDAMLDHIVLSLTGPLLADEQH
jgi:hypothetical protein